MVRTFVRIVIIAGLFLAPTAARAQTPPQPPRPTQAPRPEPPDRPQAAPRPLLTLPGQAVNVRIEVTITDQRSGEAPVQKTVGLVLADRTNGLVRSEANLRGVGNVPLHIDAEAALVERDRVLVQLGLEYNLPGGVGGTDQPPPETRVTQIRESIRAILEDGKPLVVSESADPITDRKVRVEVKAAILR